MRLQIAMIMLTLMASPLKAVYAQSAPPQTAVSTNATARYQGSANTTVSMTLYHALVAKDGKEYYLDNNGQQYPLPGTGTNDPKTVAVYTGSNGQRWYVDKTGQSIDLPPQAAPADEQVQSSPYVQYPSTADSSFQINGQNMDSPTPANVTVNNYNSAADDSDDDSASASVDAADGALLGSAWLDGIPYGYPLYADGGLAPYYWGADGYRHYINRNLANQGYFNNWSNNAHWYHGQVGTLGGRYYNQVHPAAYNRAFDHPNNLVPHDLTMNPLQSLHGQMDDHGFTPIEDRDDSGFERSGDLMNQARGDFNRGDIGNRFGDRGFGGDHGFGGGGFRGGGGGFHGGGGRR